MENNTNMTSGISFFTTGDGCRIAYKVDGDFSLPVLVLSNSIATDFSMWDGQIDNFSKYFTILRFDTRGNGLSDAPIGDYSIDRMSLDVVALLDYLKIEKIHFLGLSLGGFIGQWLGIHSPERIHKLILANTSAYLGPAKLWNENIDLLNNGKGMAFFEAKFLEGWFSKEMVQEEETIVWLFRKMIRRMSHIGLAGSYAAVRDADFRKTDVLIPNETLIIAGKNDQVTIAEHSEQIHAVVRNSKLEVLPVVHFSNIEGKDAFENLVLAFLNDDL
ncbi:alpha/beta fold hydrolase [Galbibacter pacificus]|uniref:Alpha/beta fold hydrolase n=1 Tax=Galbibacter pacificus TaxID=2996052 RepID=A0ABT6FNK1_9FLAO|nr:alpha/beta fold hydrolase [Galbibacter pacificus]MDG3581198.1 alpha/beta fold hydrolase [Galbibacter pacificus]MDG3584676.1 alpha/beta fold hydrolase [Galbibacter pacificus]